MSQKVKNSKDEPITLFPIVQPDHHKKKLPVKNFQLPGGIDIWSKIISSHTMHLIRSKCNMYHQEQLPA